MSPPGLQLQKAGAPPQTNTYQLPEETSNKHNSWVEAMYEEKLCGLQCVGWSVSIK